MRPSVIENRLSANTRVCNFALYKLGFSYYQTRFSQFPSTKHA